MELCCVRFMHEITQSAAVLYFCNGIVMEHVFKLIFGLIFSLAFMWLRKGHSYS